MPICQDCRDISLGGNGDLRPGETCSHCGKIMPDPEGAMRDLSIASRIVRGEAVDDRDILTIPPGQFQSMLRGMMDGVSIGVPMQPTDLTFLQNNEEVGKLCWTNGELRFEGNVDESARRLLEVANTLHREDNSEILLNSVQQGPFNINYIFKGRIEEFHDNHLYIVYIEPHLSSEQMHTFRDQLEEFKRRNNLNCTFLIVPNTVRMEEFRV